jgi:[acyl-carrier-protein] S-malonyltransferase
MIRAISTDAVKRLLSQHVVKKCGILFPGQGPQYVGMARKLLPIPGVDQLFEKAEEVLNEPIKKLCLEGPQDELDRTINCQPAVMLASLAALKKLEVEEPQAYENIEFAAGFSLGELTSLVASGALTLEDGLKLVRSRAKAMQQACDLAPGALSSISGLDNSKMAQLCEESRNSGEVLHVANFLFPGGQVVSGSLASVEKLEKAASKAGAKAVRRLPVSGAFHTSLMEPALEEYKETLRWTRFRPSRFPVYSNVTGLPHEINVDMVEMLSRQVCEPVLWEQSIRHILSNFMVTAIYELGPKRQLQTILQRIDSNASARLAKNIEA